MNFMPRNPAKTTNDLMEYVAVEVQVWKSFLRDVPEVHKYCLIISELAVLTDDQCRLKILVAACAVYLLKSHF